VVIRTPDQRLRVFVSSTMGELAEGLRRRSGLRAWPKLRRPEAELVARLSQREAVAAVRDRRGADTQAS
jgi:hypothetical protein